MNPKRPVGGGLGLPLFPRIDLFQRVVAVVFSEPVSNAEGAIIAAQLGQTMPISDAQTLVAAMKLAAYMRWMEIRYSIAPGNEELRVYSSSLLESEGIIYEDDDLDAIGILALTFRVDVLDAQAKRDGTFEKLDKVAWLIARDSGVPKNS
jgi:hypothetical protein